MRHIVIGFSIAEGPERDAKKDLVLEMSLPEEIVPEKLALLAKMIGDCGLEQVVHNVKMVGEQYAPDKVFDMADRPQPKQ